MLKWRTIDEKSQKKVERVPRQPGKLLELLESVGVKMRAPGEWGDESEVERRVQSDKVDDVKAVLKALEEKELRFATWDDIM